MRCGTLFMSNTRERRIVCAANRHPDTGELAIGTRHFCPLMRLNIEGFKAKQRLKYINSGADLTSYESGWIKSEQGFIDNMRVFMTRKEALALALENGQRLYRCGGDKEKLFSENLY